MERHYDVNDLAVAIGLAATVFSGSLLMTAANGTFQTAPPQPGTTSQPTGILASMVWLQPALGQAILDETLLERDGSRAITESATNLSHALVAQHRFDTSPRNLSQIVEDKAARMRTDHEGRVQTVMGRAIVNFSQRGWRNGMVPAGFEPSGFNQRMIHTTETMGQRLDAEFSSVWQPTLGRTIVDTNHHVGHRGHDSMSPRTGRTRQPCVAGRARGKSDGVNSQRDPSAKKSPPKQPTPAREQPDDAEPSPGKKATLDPESPGATIDSPTPAEPNEPA